MNTTEQNREWVENVVKPCGLVGAYLYRAKLQKLDLRGVNLSGANLRGADLSESDLRGAILVKADLSQACLYRTNFEGAVLDGADMTMSYGKSTSFKDASMRVCALRNTIYKNCFMWGTDLRWADFAGAFMLGTRFNGANLNYARNLHHARFWWYRKPGSSHAIYEPKPGYVKVGMAFPGVSFQENAGMGRTYARSY